MTSSVLIVTLTPWSNKIRMGWALKDLALLSIILLAGQTLREILFTDNHFMIAGESAAAIPCWMASSSRTSAFSLTDSAVPNSPACALHFSPSFFAYRYISLKFLMGWEIHRRKDQWNKKTWNQNRVQCIAGWLLPGGCVQSRFPDEIQFRER